MKQYILITLITLFSLNFSTADEARILRYPHASETKITFSHAGDIFTVPIEGGLARRITVSEGIEIYPRFSPDGKHIAFVGEYDGQQQIFLVNSLGGDPIRLTNNMDDPSFSERMGPNKIIMHWENDNIIYRSRHEKWHILEAKLYSISKDGGIPYTYPLPTSGYAHLSPDGKKVAYNRIYRQYRTWKRYRGGQVDNIWIYDFETEKLTQITDNDSQNIIPMWYQDKIYYISDRTGTMNLYTYDLNTKTEKQLTQYDEYDIKFPSLGKNHIAYSMGGHIYLHDLSNDLSKKVDISIEEDFPNTRPSLLKLEDNISGATINNDASIAIFTARGDIFTVTKDKFLTKNITNSSNSHDRNAIASPDGNWIAYISDETGADEIFLIKPDGTGKKQLTNDNQSYRYEMKWSPDSKMILSSDKTMRLYYIDIATGKTNLIHKSPFWEIRDFNWSPDSKWIAFTDYINSKMYGIHLYSLESKESKLITNKFFKASSPVFTPGGNYLFYVSDRTFNPSVNPLEWNFHYTDMSKIYGVPLSKKTKSLLLYEGPKKSKSDDKKDDTPISVEVDFDNIEDRVFEVPTSPGSYRSLYPSKDHKLYYSKSSTGNSPSTYVFDFDEMKESKVADFYLWEISEDGNSIFYNDKGKYYISKFSDKVSVSNDDLIKTDKLTHKVNRQEEWNQIFYEVWRQMRDFFYDENMHKVDWEAVKKRYEVLLPYVNHRADLNYVLGEMISELNVGHAYVGGGDLPKVEKISIGLLGCEYEFTNGGWKITKIYPGRNWDEKTRSPLTEPGVDIKEGDYLIAIDDIKLNKDISPNIALENKANELVKIKVNNSISENNSKEYFVKTISSEKGLRYFDWVEGRRKIVDEKTNGRVGYIHIPDMGLGNGLAEFVKYFYSQLDKEALIIDDRYNGGGNVSPMIIERLRREIGIAQFIRNQDSISAKPDATMTGPVVCLINQMSMSDGDLFPYQFKHYGLGKLIGKRTWGGVIGIRGSLPFIDGGYLMKPEFANFGVDGEWILEGTGIAPDIEIDNHPAEEMKGIDAQLNKAIEVILEEIKTNPRKQLPNIPPFPDKR